MRRWFALRTLPNSEARAEENLKRQGFEILVPRQRESIRRSGRFINVLTPLFPGYGFVSLDLERDRWRPIFGTRGVKGIVMSGERPCPIPSGVVEGLLAISVNSVIDWSMQLKAGENVRILSGPFANVIGKLETLDSRGRVAVLLEIMGATVRITTEQSNLLPLGARA